MKKYLSIGVVLCCFLLVALAFLQTQTAFSQDGEQNTKVVTPTLLSVKVAKNLAMTVNVEPQKAIFGQSLMLNVEIQNIGNEVVSYMASSPEFDFSIIVHDSQENVVSLTRYGKYVKDKLWLSFNEVKLLPGEKKLYGLKLNRIFDLSMSGSYSVVVKRIVDESDQVELVSNTVVFSIFDNIDKDESVRPEQQEGK